MTFNQLNKKQQEYAINYFVANLLKAIVENGLRFNDKLNKDRLQQRIDKALLKADAMQTPWFSHEYVQDDKYIMERLNSMAQCDAEDAEYIKRGKQFFVVERTYVCLERPSSKKRGA
jgi:hypothetical protein